MATLIKPPQDIFLPPGSRSVFLAGTIDQGNSPNWQADFADRFTEFPVTFLSPRRDHWDPSWKQTLQHHEFRRQVYWEMEGLDTVDLIAMYFHPGSKSPITLLELGLYADSGRLIVCCPNGYWRKGNVDIICSQFKIPQADALDTLVDMVKDELVHQ